MAERQIIKKDEISIGREQSDYTSSVRMANELLAAFTKHGYNLSDEQAQELINRNFNKEALAQYAETLTTAVAPVQRMDEVRATAGDLYQVILRTYPGWEMTYFQFFGAKVKDLKVTEDAKVLKQIEDKHTTFAEGEALEVFNRLQRIADELNTVFPKIRKSVFNRHLQHQFLFITNHEGKIIPNIEIINFKDF